MNRSRLPYVLAVLAAVAVLAGCNHDQPTTPSTTPTITPTMVLPVLPKPHQPVSVFGDGKYEVVTDILPGQYKTAGTATDKCYWARLKDFTGSVNSVIAMRYGANGPDVVVIEPSDKGFETRSCGTWMRVNP